MKFCHSVNPYGLPVLEGAVPRIPPPYVVGMFLRKPYHVCVSPFLGYDGRESDFHKPFIPFDKALLFIEYMWSSQACIEAYPYFFNIHPLPLQVCQTGSHTNSGGLGNPVSVYIGSITRTQCIFYDGTSISVFSNSLIYIQS